MAVQNAFEVEMRSVGSSTSLTCADLVFTVEFTVEFKDHLVGTNGAQQVYTDILNCIAGDFKRERLTARISIIVTELLKIIGYLTVKHRTDASCLLNAGRRFGLDLGVEVRRRVACLHGESKANRAAARSEGSQCA